MTCFIGVDVGTGSARAGVFDEAGAFLGADEAPIRLWRPRPGWAQQSSADIWTSVGTAVRRAVEAAGCDPGGIGGIGFDATCSMVVSGAGGAAISVDPDAAPDQDVIVWMDHRAIADAEEINRIGGAPLRHVGGVISPEMQMPKLRWLRRELPDAFAAAERFWDLPDWLVHRATGTDARSLCSAVCKWTYLGHEGSAGEGWDDAFLASIGLADLAGDGHPLIGTEFLAPGTMAGRLGAQAAAELELKAGIPVGASLIDAYAGALGTLGCGGSGRDARLAVIAGTSTCHIGTATEPVFVPGVWGPYFGAVLPGLWAVEGGQSAAGALLDAILDRHGATSGLRGGDRADAAAMHQGLSDRLASLASETATLTARRHVLPDFHGNRSPLAEPWRLGAITGLSLDVGADDLALDYLAAIQALGYGTRHVIEEMRRAGMTVGTLVVSGGLARNDLFLRETADICGCPVVVPETPEPVLLGAAMLGAVAAGARPDTAEAMAAMASPGRSVPPRGGDIAAFHERKYAVYRRMQDDHAAHEALMRGEQP